VLQSSYDGHSVYLPAGSRRGNPGEKSNNIEKKRIPVPAIFRFTATPGPLRVRSPFHRATVTVTDFTKLSAKIIPTANTRMIWYPMPFMIAPSIGNICKTLSQALRQYGLVQPVRFGVTFAHGPHGIREMGVIGKPRDNMPVYVGDLISQ